MRGAILCALGMMLIDSSAMAADRPGALRRASCAVVKYYVAKYSEAAAESWARGHGATDAEIAAAKKCLAGPSAVQTASFAAKR